MKIKAHGWSRYVSTRLIASYDLSNNISETCIGWDAPRVTFENDCLNIGLRVSISRGSPMCGDYVYKIEFPLSDLVAFLWIVLKKHGLSTILMSLARHASPDQSQGA